MWEVFDSNLHVWAVKPSLSLPSFPPALPSSFVSFLTSPSASSPSFVSVLTTVGTKPSPLGVGTISSLASGKKPRVYV